MQDDLAEMKALNASNTKSNNAAIEEMSRMVDQLKFESNQALQNVRNFKTEMDNLNRKFDDTKKVTDQAVSGIMNKLTNSHEGLNRMFKDISLQQNKIDIEFEKFGDVVASVNNKNN